MSLVDQAALRRVLEEADPTPLTGTVVRATGLIVEATLPRVPVGTACEIRAGAGATVLAEVVGFQGGVARLMPLGELQGIGEGCDVVPRASADRLAVGDDLAPISGSTLSARGVAEQSRWLLQALLLARKEGRIR